MYQDGLNGEINQLEAMNTYLNPYCSLAYNTRCEI
jgi:hypothetical protein